jgi:hypothetical protein
LQRFLVELGQAAGAGASPLFVAANRVTGWGWLPFKALAHDASEKTTEKIRALVAERSDLPSLGIGKFASGIDGFRRSSASPAGPLSRDRSSSGRARPARRNRSWLIAGRIVGR